MCFGLLSVPDDAEVLAYPYMVVYASGVQECRWILRNEELASASLSNADASFVYAIRCTLQRAHIIMLIAFILSKFISCPKCSLNIENKSLLL